MVQTRVQEPTNNKCLVEQYRLLHLCLKRRHRNQTALLMRLAGIKPFKNKIISCCYIFIFLWAPKLGHEPISQYFCLLVVINTSFWILPFPYLTCSCHSCQVFGPTDSCPVSIFIYTYIEYRRIKTNMPEINWKRRSCPE